MINQVFQKLYINKNNKYFTSRQKKFRLNFTFSLSITSKKMVEFALKMKRENIKYMLKLLDAWVVREQCNNIPSQS